MIRRMQEEDLTKVMTLWVKGNFQGNYFIQKDYWLEIYNNTKEKILKRYHTYVYEEKNDILGFISIKGSEIKAIAVKESEKRKGIGRKIIHYCLETKTELEVTIYERNVTAFLFFSALGFKNIGLQINQKFAEKEYKMKKSV